MVWIIQMPEHDEFDPKTKRWFCSYWMSKQEWIDVHHYPATKAIEKENDSINENPWISQIEWLLYLKVGVYPILQGHNLMASLQAISRRWLSNGINSIQSD